MQKIEFKLSENKELIKAIIDELPFLSRFDVQKILKNKDAKVNGVRCSENIKVEKNDNITVFYNEKKTEPWHKLVYSDNNIIIVGKRAGIEVVSEDERDLLNIIKKEYPNATAVHRLDRNTEGLVVFALNAEAEQSLLESFKTRNGITKKYALLVDGRVDISKIKRTIYLKKIDKLSKVWVSEVKTSGYEQAITEFDVVEYQNDKTLLEATLITGKTHQIRAHISYFGYPIVGDNKYGKSNHSQMCLTANYLSFNFKKGNYLSYLNNKSFEIVPTWLN